MTARFDGKYKVLARIFIVGILMLASVAHADTRTVPDPDDTGGPLDVMTITQRHIETTQPGQRLLVHSIEMYEPWDNSVLADSPNSMSIYFDIDGDLQVERELLIGANGDGSLGGIMFSLHPRGGRGRVRGFARVTRPDDRTVEVTFPKVLLEKGITRYRWNVHTLTDSPDDPECGNQGDTYVYCGDNAPQTTLYIKHRL
jgi:hypothetical protein